jgi:hypothetical protein
MALYAVAGLATKIELPVPLIIDLIPRSQTKQRPGIPRQKPGFWVQHETGNPRAGADAVMHNRYLHNGAEGQTLSYHFTSDDRVIYQMIPIDEVTWQAADGNGPGNMSGISCELCINQGINTARSRTIAEALAGGVMKALNMEVSRCKRHWDFNGSSPDRHHCPDQMMAQNYWPTFVTNVGKIIAPTPPKPQYPAPGPWDFDIHTAVGWQLHGGTEIFMSRFTDKCIKNAVPRVVADSGSAKAGATIPAGTMTEFLGFFIGDDGNGWRILKTGARIRASSFESEVEAEKR